MYLIPVAAMMMGMRIFIMLVVLWMPLAARDVQVAVTDVTKAVAVGAEVVVTCEGGWSRAGKSGADGVAVGVNYLGTAGLGDAGLAKFEGDPDVTIVCTDDCGSGLRVAVNTGVVTHANANNRIAIITGNSSAMFTVLMPSARDGAMPSASCSQLTT